MKSILYIILFLIVSVLVGVAMPYDFLIRNHIASVVSIDTAIKITDIVLGGDPEPYDGLTFIIGVIINCIISVLLCCAVIKIWKKLKQTSK